MAKIKITIEIDDDALPVADPCQGCPSKENWKWNGGCVGDCPRRMNQEIHWCGDSIPFKIEPYWPDGTSGSLPAQEMWITQSDGSVVRQHPPAIRYG